MGSLALRRTKDSPGADGRPLVALPTKTVQVSVDSLARGGGRGGQNLDKTWLRLSLTAKWYHHHYWTLSVPTC